MTPTATNTRTAKTPTGVDALTEPSVPETPPAVSHSSLRPADGIPAMLA